jgi:hypothetical protein
MRYYAIFEKVSDASVKKIMMIRQEKLTNTSVSYIKIERLIHILFGA